ncbi:flavanone 3-dioxygenase 2-like [Elaeis guineensis]|uniref:LOW QUALITY PROTEIN: flavanone 3-dioxygenase 2-like n=1 Tax=Elaeis guineensis var. tenera TaxID=51953 RepID=A0A6J0PGY8_ELAGV|nr:LOW QUALITY PROTEIN: flavanone 3-dioxygenase 2-like [Elaeis guineensis]
MADQLLSTGPPRRTLPESYIRPESQRPRLTAVESDANIPVIDLSTDDLSQIMSQIRDACQYYGFFQIVNHGMPTGLMVEMKAIAREFFSLPPEEKAKLYSDDPAKKIRLSTSFNIRKETVRNWRDYLRLHCYPLEDFVPVWPSKPPSFREVVSTYCREVRQLGFRLLGLISLSLGLEEDYIEKVLGEQEQHMAINYYPQCPEPELTYGLQAHTDPNALTILLQDQKVAGLQVLKDDKWIRVDPRPNALVINIGDQLQALSNGRYKSVWHRAVVNSDKERISVASFLCPCNGAVISPAMKLTGEGSPAIYRSFTYDEYYKKFWSRNLDQEHCLELFKR